MSAIPQTLKRINRELITIQADLPEGILSAGPKSSSNIYDWQGSVAGPSGTCYEGGVFHFNIYLPRDYPFHPPSVTFRTKIFHPNIDPQGSICLDILKHKWSPAMSVLKVLLSIICLLEDPNPRDPLVGEIANMYLHNRAKFEATARQWVATYATPPPTPKLNLETKKPSVQPTSQAPKAAIVDIDDDDEIEVVRTNSARSVDTSISTGKRQAQDNSLESSPSFSPQNTCPTAIPNLTHPAKRPRNQVIELD